MTVCTSGHEFRNFCFYYTEVIPIRNGLLIKNRKFDLSQCSFRREKLKFKWKRIKKGGM